MAVPGTIQALIAAFSFGILFNAASAALVLYIKGHGSAIYRDGLRLVLILFLFTSSSWALVEFLATLIDPSATSTCQVAVIFSSLFDQFGRVFVEQYLVWAVRKGDAKTPFSLLPQILVFGRLFVGIAFTAVTRPQFKPTCAPISSIRAVSFTAIALDAVIIGLLAIQAFSGSMAGKESNSRSPTQNSKTARLIVVGVALWWGTSVTSLLGLESLDLFYKTALPGIGLTVLVALVTILSQSHGVPRQPPRRPDSPVSREARDLSSSDSTDYPPSRYEDLKETNGLPISGFTTKTEATRNIRRNDDGTFPTISRPMTAGSDVNRNLIQEQLFSVPKSSDLAPALSAIPPLPESWGMIKTASGRMKAVPKAKTKAEKLAISNPILNEDEKMQTSLKRIPTIALAEAAVNDKLRREKYARRISAMIAQRPAPRPPSPQTSPEMLTTEPEVAGELERSESTRSNRTSSGLSVEVNASSTGTQLSPGVEAVRRRSPRQPEPTTLATPFRVIRPGEPIRIPIPRPQERDQNPPATKPEPVKTPLQRRPTIGLPSNPRAQTLKPSAKETSNQKTQTVMFVNNIVYSNPNAVGDIIQEATKVPQPPNSGDTVVNRPRPIPRKGDKDRQVFPAEFTPDPQHRRSKSVGSIVSRKSILQSVSGSPTGLPSLPPMPPMTSTTTRPVPNSTKSMTVEEKMNLLYPTKSSALSSTELSMRRRSSVPNIPTIPVVPQDEHLQLLVDTLSDTESNNDLEVSRGSKRSTARTSSLLGITVGYQNVSQSNAPAASFKSRDPVGELGNTWLPGIPSEQIAMSKEVKRRSSPVIPVGRPPSMSTSHSEARFGDEETMTNWGSVYSPAVPVSRQNARSTYIRKVSRNAASSEEFPIMMFDESLEGLGGSGPSPDSKGDESPSGNSDISQHLSGHFYRRPGDDCPTFSTRADKTRPRKMPPPTPLVLNGRTTKREIIIQVAEPSPLESPRAAYEVIQAQLRNFEKPERDSMENPGRRLALLANLEQEMGQLESKWQSTHDHLGRESMSSIKTSPSPNSRPASLAPTLSRPSSQRSSIAYTIAERRASRRARIPRGGGEETLDTSSQNLLQSSENPRGTASQILTEAHVQQAPELLMKHNDSTVLSILKASLGNPSPPETDESDLDMESEATRSTSPIHVLWSQRESKREPSKSWLWEPQTRMSQNIHQSYKFPGVCVRLATRKHLSPLTIESSHLWQNNSKLMPIKSHEGLWNSQPSSRRPGLAKALVRPVTIRPPRKNKRVTLLPDIIENPEPLPDKRGTLGIFQFPWGEKSEHASIQYRPSQVSMAMPGTMTTGNSVGNAMVVAKASEFEATEYSSSFFDDYEEEGDNFSDFSGSGDDEFDETTLWEIASLLQTDRIPSRDSLLPMPLQSPSLIDPSVLSEYDTDMPSDDEDGNENIVEDAAIVKHTAAVEEQNISDDIVRPLLWTPQHTSQDRLQKFGLPQHESWSWKLNERIIVPPNRTRAQSLTDELNPIWSTKLWSPMTKEARSPDESLLWAASKNTSEPQATSYAVLPVQIQQRAPTLWVKSGAMANSTTQRVVSTFGLPGPEPETWQGLISVTSVVKRSKSQPNRSLLSINSSVLWSQSKKTDPKTLWTQPSLSPVFENNGLFRPGALRADYRTTTQSPAALSLSKRAFRRNSISLEPITSINLWSLKISTFVKPSTADLWKPDTNSPEVATIKPVPTLAANSSLSGLWKRPVQVQTPASLGLFDSEAPRYDFRRTSKPPVAIITSTTPRLVRENTSVLTSRNLWAPQHVQATVVKDEKVSFLWKGKRSTNAKSTPTLFEVDAGRINYRTTSADPAALVIVRKPRTIQLPLQALESSHLWSTSQVVRLEVDWITMGAAYPTSSSPPSPSRARSAAPVLAATTSSKSKGGFFSSLFGKKTNKDSATTVAPEGERNATTSNYDLELPEGIIVKNLDMITRAKPVHNANWDAAPAEAVAASHPRTILALRASYPQDWDAQLGEALIAAYVAPKISLQRATPRDWSLALHQAVFESYPELRYSRGQTLAYPWNAEIQNKIVKDEILDYDVTIRHPVFFGSLKTAAEIVHPALTGYRVGIMDASMVASASPSTSPLWTKSVESQATIADGLWTFGNERDSNLNIMPQRMQNNNITSHYPMRGNKVARSLSPEMETGFGKQGLWN
ncbi:hypothetical protein E0Z10_g207 [Xylaria hypoxylon]|uniref:Uncharacterized protein n=1 Tax=Xylaria hypoxylon TaxID=37992 RepID=A0A4Z0ZAB4_9PEZI|nr:hypothetical protein E0Z10_g207 [Xylaria hypoxylon]